LAVQLGLDPPALEDRIRLLEVARKLDGSRQPRRRPQRDLHVKLEGESSDRRQPGRAVPPDHRRTSLALEAPQCLGACLRRHDVRGLTEAVRYRWCEARTPAKPPAAATSAKRSTTSSGVSSPSQPGANTPARTGIPRPARCPAAASITASQSGLQSPASSPCASTSPPTSMSTSRSHPSRPTASASPSEMASGPGVGSTSRVREPRNLAMCEGADDVSASAQPQYHGTACRRQQGVGIQHRLLRAYPRDIGALPKKELRRSRRLFLRL